MHVMSVAEAVTEREPGTREAGGDGAMKPPPLDWISLLGVRVTRLTRAGALETLQAFIESGDPHLVVTADSSAVVIAREDEEFRRIVNAADLVTADSTGILWATRRQGQPLPERVSGCDLAEQLCAMSAREGYSVFLYGAAPGVAEEAAARMKARYPGLTIAGTAHGFLGDTEQEQLIETIRAARPHVLLVAMGIPRQEKWIHRNLTRLNVPVSIGVGGSFDVFAGRVRRAPLWMQRHGLEWAYRLAANPKKIAKVLTLPRFVWMVLRQNKTR
jgi:N-acetylglucosaminyldiphosphoundecaprenol N-acetyl-beta-D-mannosaminyltransferase